MNECTPAAAPGYEPSDASPRRLLLVGGGIAAGIILSIGIALVVYIRFDRRATPRGPVARQTSFQHSAQATSDIAADWTRADAEVHQHLQTYGWVDRQAGVVRIPIDIAMQRLVDEAKARKESK